MNSAPKEKSKKPGSNYQEETPKGKVPSGNKAVKKPEDKDYTKDQANFKNIAQKREKEEQPVHPVKTPPKK